MTENKSNEHQSAKDASPWEPLRYIIIAAIIIGGTWYYFSQKPLAFSSEEISGRTMGTDYSVKVFDFPEAKKTQFQTTFKQEVQKCLDNIDSKMSTYRDDSDVCRFNASDSIDWFPVSPETAEVVELALQVSQLTSGAFDVTIAPLVDLWGFGPNKKKPSLVEIEATIPSLKESVGFDKLSVQKNPPALKKSHPNLHIDLSAIAKGYAVDSVADLLEQHGLHNYMIEVGGEVRCRGTKGLRGKWVIGIEKPLIVPPDVMPGIQKKLFLDNQSMATSGDYLNYYELDGKRFSHIIDPRTGLPTEKIELSEEVPKEKIGAVSVLDKSCTRADALATAMFVLGEKAGIELANQEGIAVLFLMRSNSTESQSVRESPSNTFPTAND
ncbi:MAG: FAD:protein FMN transferase [Thermoguttaceae bacterium]